VPTATTTSIVPPRRRHRRHRRAIRVYSVILVAAMLMAIAFSWLLRHLV
jgi:type VI protein secretion system component VasF